MAWAADLMNMWPWAADDTPPDEHVTRQARELFISLTNKLGSREAAATQDLSIFPLCHPRPGHHAQALSLHVPRWHLCVSCWHSRVGKGERYRRPRARDSRSWPLSEVFLDSIKLPHMCHWLEYITWPPLATGDAERSWLFSIPACPIEGKGGRSWEQVPSPQRQPRQFLFSVGC